MNNPVDRRRVVMLAACMGVIICVEVAVVLAAHQKLRRKRRRMWARKWLLRRPMHGVYEKLLQELTREDTPSFRNFSRLDVATFWEMVDRLAPRIVRQDTFWRRSICPALRLAITLRFLATGDSYKSLGYHFRVAPNTISLIVPDTCEAIFAEYGPEVLKCPSNPAQWRMVAQLFEDRWQFPHVVGAIDGKHISIRNPHNSGSVYYNYKGFFSIVLLAVVDADYKFLYCDVGATGSGSDGGVFARSTIKQALENGTLGLPPDEPLVPGGPPVPYFLVGDDAFPMRTWLLKGYPQRTMSRAERIYNYRLSRARRVVENAFGILASRFRCLLTTMLLKPKNVESVVLACCCLHNLLRSKNRMYGTGLLDLEDQTTHDVVPGLWREGGVLQPVVPQRGNTITTRARDVRTHLTDYFGSPTGRVAWQDAQIQF